MIRGIMSSHSKDRQQSNASVQIQSSKTATMIDTDKKQHAIGSSFHGKINTILKQWHQLQQEKKQCQQQQQQTQLLPEKKSYQYDEFDRIMEEDLENQLKELERQEDEQCKQMEKAIEEQLEQDQHSEHMDAFEQNYIEQFKQIEELERFEHEEQQQQQQSNQVIMSSFKAHV